MGRVSKSITLPEDTWALLEEKVRESKYSSKGRFIEHLISYDSTGRIAELEQQLQEQKQEKAQLLEILQRLSSLSPATSLPIEEAVAQKQPEDEIDLAIGDMLL